MQTSQTTECPLRMLVALAAVFLLSTFHSMPQQDAIAEETPGKQTVELKAGDLTIVLGNEYDTVLGRRATSGYNRRQREAAGENGRERETTGDN